MGAESGGPGVVTHLVGRSMASSGPRWAEVIGAKLIDCVSKYGKQYLEFIAWCGVFTGR